MVETPIDGYTVITSADVPDGTAWAGTWIAHTPYETPILEFTLPAPMLRVGAYVDGTSSSSITMNVTTGILCWTPKA